MSSPVLTTCAATDRAIRRFEQRFGASPTVVVRAPGQVNLLGDHMDATDGFVLPIALPHATAIAAGPREGSKAEVCSEGFDDSTFDTLADPRETEGWARYVHGMAAELARVGVAPRGWMGAVASDIPQGIGLGSSAALEVATGMVLSALAAQRIEAQVLASAGRRVEGRLFRRHTGAVDHLASMLPRAGTAVLLDRRSVRPTIVALPTDTIVVVLDTGTRRQQDASAYPDQHATCAAAARRLHLTSLRDAGGAELSTLPDDLRAPARHVVTENQRTLDAVDAALAGDATALGALMSASHISLRNDFGVSSPALDTIVATAEEHKACFGARLTGGGFAGCAIALVDATGAAAFVEHMHEAYRPPWGQPASAPMQCHPVVASAGASIIRG